MTDPPTRVSIQSDDLAVLHQKDRVEDVSRFGSALRADFCPDSDLDPVGMFRPDAEIGFLELAALPRELSSALGRRVDLVPKEGPRPIVRDGVFASAPMLAAVRRGRPAAEG